MKLFVSYRRKSWGFTQRLAEKLERRLDAEIFIDYNGIDTPVFARSLMRHLRDSDAMLLIVSEHTFAPDRIHNENDWVRREIREALRLGIPIVVAFVDGQPIPGDIPRDIEEIRQMQGVNFYPEFFNAALIKLVSFITKATPIKRLKPQNRKVQVERSLREVKQGLAKIESGASNNISELLAEFQSYLTSIEEFMDVKPPKQVGKPRSDPSDAANKSQQIALPYTLKLLDDLVQSLAFTDADTDDDSDDVPPGVNSGETTPHDFQSRDTTPPSMHWLDDLSKNPGDGQSPDDLINRLYPPPPPDLPP